MAKALQSSESESEDEERQSENENVNNVNNGGMRFEMLGANSKDPEYKFENNFGLNKKQTQNMMIKMRESMDKNGRGEIAKCDVQK